jgi:histidinol dehydrogenase
MSGEGMSGKAMSIVNRLATGDADFDARLRSLLAFEATQDESIESAVTQILAAVR